MERLGYGPDIIAALAKPHGIVYLDFTAHSWFGVAKDWKGYADTVAPVCGIMHHMGRDNSLTFKYFGQYYLDNVGSISALIGALQGLSLWKTRGGAWRVHTSLAHAGSECARRVPTVSVNDFVRSVGPWNLEVLLDTSSMHLPGAGVVVNSTEHIYWTVTTKRSAFMLDGRTLDYGKIQIINQTVLNYVAPEHAVEWFEA